MTDKSVTDTLFINMAVKCFYLHNSELWIEYSVIARNSNSIRFKLMNIPRNLHRPTIRQVDPFRYLTHMSVFKIKLYN